MKFQSLTIAALAASFLVACGPSEAEQKAAREKAVADSIAAAAAAEHAYTLDAATSTINWAGNVTGPAPYGHKGTIAFNSGTFSTQGGFLKTGTFEVNMTSINPTDDAYQPEGSKQGTKSQLIGHLSTADFFDSANHPTAKLVITEVSGNTATGDLTIRGTTNKEKVTDIVITENADGTVTATGKLTFDRQKYGVAWKHFMKDAILADNIDLEISLNGKAAQ
ncbi:MAG: YceI family protein [Flavobacteriales bacterium]|nr:YceI family protein [Flavobacteriales bacterium]